MKNGLSIEQIAQLSKRVKFLLLFDLMGYGIVAEKEEITSTVLYGTHGDKKVFEYEPLAEINITCKGKKVADEDGPAYEMFSQYEILSQIPTCYLNDVIGYSLKQELGKMKQVKKLQGTVSFKMSIYSGELPEEAVLAPVTLNGKKI